jgi:ABC-type uncharacterized transport system ATPase subunit
MVSLYSKHTDRVYILLFHQKERGLATEQQVFMGLAGQCHKFQAKKRCKQYWFEKFDICFVGKKIEELSKGMVTKVLIGCYRDAQSQIINF